MGPMRVLRCLVPLVVMLLFCRNAVGEQWCVAIPGANEAALQKGIDYACADGTDCSAIQPGGSCYEPNTIHDHASYAYNAYYNGLLTPPSAATPPSPAQWKGPTCDFDGTAMLTHTDPSTATCKYPGHLICC